MLRTTQKGKDFADDEKKDKQQYILQLFLRRKPVESSDLHTQRTSASLPSLTQQPTIERRKAARNITLKEPTPKVIKQRKVSIQLDADPITKPPKLDKIYTNADTVKVEEQVRSELFQFLTKYKQLDFLQCNSSTLTKSLRTLESKVKHEYIQDNDRRYNQHNKEIFGIKNLFSRQFQNFTTQRCVKIPKHKFDLKKHFTTRKNLDDSYASYTEVKLTELYAESKTLQKFMKKGGNSELDTRLIQTCRSIIKVSNTKMNK